MLKPVQQDKQGGLLEAELLTADTIRSFQDDKVKEWPLADSLSVLPIDSSLRPEGQGKRGNRGREIDWEVVENRENGIGYQRLLFTIDH